MSFNADKCDQSENMESQEGMEDEDELMRKMEEETNIAIMNISNDQMDRFEFKSSKPPVQLAVDVEVEPCDETEDLDKTWIKAESPKKEQRKVSKKIKKTKRKSNDDTKESNEIVYSARIDTDKLFEELNDYVTKSKNPVDVKIAIHTRNLWGKLVKTPHVRDELDEKIQKVINSFRTKDIISYKCYICIQAWWHLYPFREHVKEHDNVNIALEKGNFVANVVALAENTVVIRPIPIDGDCFRCNKPYEAHIDYRGKYIRCELGYYKPKTYERLEQCTICSYIGDLNAHNLTCHTVRSDVPIDTKAKACKLCNELYYVFTMHECIKRMFSMFCYTCHSHFGTGLRLENHVMIRDKPYHCKYCTGIITRYCMEPYHLLNHTYNFMTVELCTICKGNLVFFSPSALRDHIIKKHMSGYIKKSPYLIILPKSFFNPPEENKAAIPLNIQSTSAAVEADSEFEEDEEMIINPEKIKIEGDDDQGFGYEMLLSRVFNSSSKTKTTRNADIEAVTEAVVDKVVDNTNVEAPVSNLDNVKFVALPSNTVINPANDVTNIDVDSDESIGDDISKDIHLLSNIKFKVINSEKDISADKTVSDVNNDNVNDNYVSDDDDVQIIEVKNEILEIEDDVDDMDIQDDANTADLNKDTNTDVTIKNGVNVNNLVEISVNGVTDNNVITGIQTLTTETGKDLPVKPYSEFEVFITNNLKDGNGGNPQYEIRIKNEFSDNANEVNQIQNFGQDTNDSDSDYQLHIASDAEMEDDPALTQVIEGQDGASDESGFMTKQRRTYTCKCGFTAYHMEYKAHWLQCHLKRKYNKSGLPRKNKKSTKIQPRTSGRHTPGLDLEDVVTFPCTKCNKTYYSLMKYLLHFVYHGYRKNACPVCSEIQRDNSALSLHFKTDHIKQSYYKSRCILSGASASSFLGLNCKVCKKPVHRKYVFKHWEKHLKIHEEELQQIKEENLMEMLENTNLERSLLKKVLEILEPTYNLERQMHVWRQGCVVCKHVFKRRSDYKRHLIEHLLADAQQNRPLYHALRCQICTSDMNRDREFRQHIREHACLAVYKCRPCNREFSNSSNFSKHKKLHNPDAITCDICKKKFHTKIAIEKHMILDHITFEKRRCDLCQKVFYDMALYRLHAKTQHKSVQGLGCSICKDRFGNTKTLLDHMWLAHRQRKVSADCFVCGKQFRRYSDLKKHMNTIHNVSITRECLKRFVSASNSSTDEECADK